MSTLIIQINNLNYLGKYLFAVNLGQTLPKKCFSFLMSKYIRRDNVMISRAFTGTYSILVKRNVTNI